MRVTPSTAKPMNSRALVVELARCTGVRGAACSWPPSAAAPAGRATRRRRTARARRSSAPDRAPALPAPARLCGARRPGRSRRPTLPSATSVSSGRASVANVAMTPTSRSSTTSGYPANATIPSRLRPGRIADPRIVQHVVRQVGLALGGDAPDLQRPDRHPRVAAVDVRVLAGARLQLQRLPRVVDQPDARERHPQRSPRSPRSTPAASSRMSRCRDSAVLDVGAQLAVLDQPGLQRLLVTARRDVARVDGDPDVGHRVRVDVEPAVERRVVLLERRRLPRLQHTRQLLMHPGADRLGGQLPQVLSDDVGRLQAAQRGGGLVREQHGPVPVVNAERVADPLQHPLDAQRVARLLVLDPLGHVAADADQPDRLAGRVVHERPERLQPADRAVRSDDSIEQLVLDAACDVLLDGRQHPLAIVRVQVRLVRLERAGEAADGECRASARSPATSARPR